MEDFLEDPKHVVVIINKIQTLTNLYSADSGIFLLFTFENILFQLIWIYDKDHDYIMRIFSILYNNKFLNSKTESKKKDYSKQSQTKNSIRML